MRSYRSASATYVGVARSGLNGTQPSIGPLPRGRPGPPPVATALLDWVRLVGVAQLVELRVVVPAVAGSNPVAHPQEIAAKPHIWSSRVCDLPPVHGPFMD